MIIHDERDSCWLILSGDPAYPLVRALKKQGQKAIRLPESAILTGKVQESDLPSNSAIKQVAIAYDKDHAPELGRAFLTLVVLYDCVTALLPQGEESGKVEA